MVSTTWLKENSYCLKYFVYLTECFQQAGGLDAQGWAVPEGAGSPPQRWQAWQYLQALRQLHPCSSQVTNATALHVLSGKK